MKILVDTSVRSSAFRRDSPPDDPAVRRWPHALRDEDVVVTCGVVVRELRQGLLPVGVRTTIQNRILALPSIVPTVDGHVEASEIWNRCRRAGVQLGTVDALIARLSIAYSIPLLSTDRDFEHAARVVPLELVR